MRFFPYRYHKNAQYGKDSVDLESIPERVTYLSFEEWKTLYHGDPENWSDFINTNTDFHFFTYHIPVYTKFIQKSTYRGEPYEIAEYIYIKFLTRADFKKYERYIKTILKSGEDFENLREIEELAKYIGEIADKRLHEIQERMQKAIDDNQKLIEETRLKNRAEMSGGKQIELSL